MKEEKEIEETEGAELVRIGDILISSHTLDAETLTQLALHILKDDNVKKYIEHNHIEKTRSSMIG